MNSQFIEFLYNRKTSFPAPEEARDKAKACDLLSKDIYKDSTRFAYELLQNADDASCSTNNLDFQIDFCGDYLIVSHKGKPFSDNDVESICSIGDGMKSNDEGQTGFKGIGFKSVFAHANLVIIKSGDFCFKFDREACNVWDPKWGNQNEWEETRRSKGKDVDFRMPWQVIPMNTSLPSEIAYLSVFCDSSFHVSTILKCKKVQSLQSAIESLFSEAQLILFLRCANVRIVINSTNKLCIEKKTLNGITSVYRNDEVISQWLMKVTDPFEVPSKVRDAIEEDKDHYPEKLREAKKTTMSFAINLVDNKLKLIGEKFNNIFAFLPTSVSVYALPFIVNANFITDAGRQNLHQDYVWNQWLFEEMPKRFVEWMAELAKSKQYGLDYLKLIVKDAGANDELSSSYKKGIESALLSTPILPREDDQLVLVKDAIWDQTNICSFVTKQLFVKYINKDSKSFVEANILPRKYQFVEKSLKSLGVYTFTEESLAEFMKSDEFVNNHSVSENSGLIDFLTKRYPFNKQSENRDHSWLKDLTFVYNNREILSTPESLCFPNSQYSSEYSDDIDYIHENVFSSLSEESIDWLSHLGTKEPSDVSIVETGKVFEEGFVNNNNAIDILLFLFDLHSKGLLAESHYESLHKIKLLTQKNTFETASNCYLADRYKPNLTIEKYVDVDFFVSTKYLDRKATASEWNVFLSKIGVTSDLTRKYIEITSSEIDSTNLVFKSFVREAKRIAQLYSWISWEGWSDTRNGYGFGIGSIAFYGIPYMTYATKFEFSRLLWSNIISNCDRDQFFNSSVTVYGYTGMISRSISGKYLSDKGLETNYIKWALNSQPIVPGSDHSCHYAKDVFTNTIPNANLIAGDYLPVIAVDVLVDESWAKSLGLKTEFKLSDYLHILQYVSTKEDLTQEDKERILSIYNILASMVETLPDSQKEELVRWASSNKILARDNKFYSPKELSIITVEGFTGNHFAYTGQGTPSDSLLKLMKLLGVQVIDKVELTTTGNKVSINALKDKLYSLAPIFALLNNGIYSESLEKVDETLKKIDFLYVNSIDLSYGNDEDKISKKAHYDPESKCFYIVGNWDSMRVLDSIENPLGKLLHLSSYSHMLKVLLTSELEECIEYLKEYDIEVSESIEQEINNRKIVDSNIILVDNSDETNGIVAISISDTPYAGLSKDTMAEALIEAKKVVRRELEQQGFSFENATGLDASTYGNIYGVMDPNNKECPLVVHSYRNQNRDFELTAFDWLQLAQPNSMLYVYTHQGAMCVPFYKLMSDRGKINISFSTENAECKDRMIILASILSHFKGLHFDFGSLLPACTKTAERFNQPEKEMYETLSADDAYLML